MKDLTKYGTHNMIDSTYEIEYDANGHLVFFKNSTGWWWRKEYDERDNCVYHEDASGMWVIHKFDEHGNEIYYENYLGFKRGTA